MMLNTIDGKIKDTNLKWEDDHCATVVMASDGYPGKFEKKTVIKKELIKKELIKNKLFSIYLLLWTC